MLAALDFGPGLPTAYDIYKMAMKEHHAAESSPQILGAGAVIALLGAADVAVPRACLPSELAAHAVSLVGAPSPTLENLVGRRKDGADRIAARGAISKSLEKLLGGVMVGPRGEVVSPTLLQQSFWVMVRRVVAGSDVARFRGILDALSKMH